MKSARKHYEEFPVMSDAERLARLEGMTGVELIELMHYADGREESELRDEVMMRVLGISGRRYLGKQAKAAKKVKRIL